ncbi:MAG TPA: enoyl-CoA hydratase/isomerase family protein [Thermoanaerobaculia bacterium]|jgi:enoyl-CoA hydratase/carnithine racemase|nr:enoyl-CoA hydratase/isomerase family protein [Thermoanaerobaculia bacterium]
MSNLVLRSDDGGVAFLTLNRPDALNAVSPALFVELRAHLDAIAANVDSVGCVVLRGAGRSFCAGNDLKAIQAGERAPEPHYQADTLQAIEDLPQPVIASVQGHCYTGGLELALACDLLIAGESARFADTHGRWGMTPTWGMTQRLPRRIGPLRAKELMLSGRTVDGREAAAIGLANRCVPDAELESTTLELAKQIVANSWHTLRADKKLVNQGQDFGLEQGLAYERRESPGASPDTAQRVASFGKK